jgi:hypothetical protein
MMVEYNKPDNRPKLVNTYNVKRSTAYYKNNPKAKAKKDAYNKKYHDTDERRAYRAELSRERRKRGLMGTAKGKGKDISHKKGGGVTVESSSVNRARNRGKK